MLQPSAAKNAKPEITPGVAKCRPAIFTVNAPETAARTVKISIVARVLVRLRCPVREAWSEAIKKAGRSASASTMAGSGSDDSSPAERRLLIGRTPFGDRGAGI